MDTPKIRVAATQPLKILTFNTASFNFGPSWYRKVDGLSFHSTIRVELIKEMIAQSQPDFLCLQESVLTAASTQAKGGVTSSSSTSSTAAGHISKKTFPGCLGDLGPEWCLVGDPSTTHANCTVLLARRSFFEEDQDPDGHHRTIDGEFIGGPRFVKATAVVSASQRPGSSTGVRRTTTGAPPSTQSSSMIRGNDFPIGVFRVPLIADTTDNKGPSATTHHDDKSPRPSAFVTLAISSVHLAPMKENAKARAGQMNTVLKSLFSAAVSSSQKSRSSFPSSFSACVVDGDFNMRSEERSVPVSLSSSSSSPWKTEDTLFAAAATRHPASSCLFENETPFSSGDDDTTPPNSPDVKLKLHGTFGGRNEFNGPHLVNEGKDLLSEDAADETHFLSSDSGLRYDRVVVGVRNNSAASRGRGNDEVASCGGTSGAAVMKKRGEEEEGGELRVVVKKYQLKGTKRVDPQLVKSEMDKVPIEEMDQVLARQPKSVRDAMKKRQIQSGKPPTIEAIATMQRQNAALFERPQGLYLSDHVGVLVELQFETFADLL